MFKKIVLGLIAIVIVGFVGTAAWMVMPFSYQEKIANASLTETDTIKVTTEPWIVFQPKHNKKPTGIIFYPGGKTTAVTFAPVMKQYASAGYTAVITPMPLKTAFLGINKADDVIAAYPEISQWVIAGHSLGGVAASEYVKTADFNKVKALLLWASYPASDISQLSIDVVSISASQDLQSTPQKINQNKGKLPPSTRYIEIEGGNHWQYGYYGRDNNQQSNLISFEQQQAQIFAESLALLAEITNN